MMTANDGFLYRDSIPGVLGGQGDRGIGKRGSTFSYGCVHALWDCFDDLVGNISRSNNPAGIDICVFRK